MNNSKILAAALAVGLASSLAAQNVQTIPKGYLKTEGSSSSSYPFNTTNMRVQYSYDSTHINSAGPVLISRLRVRANGSTTATWTGGTLAGVSIKMASSPFNWNAQTTTFASNLNKDVKTVFTGSVTIAPLASGGAIPQTGWYVDIKLPTPFLYDPSLGKDLIIDYTVGAFTGTSRSAQDVTSGAADMSSRMYAFSTTATTGSIQQNVGLVTEINWVPAKGLYSSFSADKTSGPAPLTVQFKDTTYTSSAGGVKTWAWDFDGDNKIDSNKQNPTWTYKKTTWDATYDVSLTTTDGTFPTSKVTKKAFITVDPSDAFAVDFGKGSTNKPVNSPIGQPVNTSIYSAAAGVRGFHFVAPTTFVITGFEAPNDATPKEADQTVTCYVLAKPPAASYTATAADVKFHATGKANTILKPSKPIIVNKGDWVGVFGACHATTAASPLRNAYATGGYKTTVLGQPITIERMWMNADPRVNKGVGTINPTTGTIARVFIYVSGNTTVPLMTTNGAPKLGATATLDLQGKFAGIQGGVVFMSAGRLPVPVPTAFGNLLINPAIVASIFVPTGTGLVPLTVPNSSALKGVIVDWQGLVFDLTTNTFGMTNGTEWFLGK